MFYFLPAPPVSAWTECRERCSPTGNPPPTESNIFIPAEQRRPGQFAGLNDTLINLWPFFLSRQRLLFHSLADDRQRSSWIRGASVPSEHGDSGIPGVSRSISGILAKSLPAVPASEESVSRMSCVIFASPVRKGKNPRRCFPVRLYSEGWHGQPLVLFLAPAGTQGDSGKKPAGTFCSFHTGIDRISASKRLLHFLRSQTPPASQGKCSQP